MSKKAVTLAGSVILAVGTLLANVSVATANQPVTVTVAFNGTEFSKAEIDAWNKAHPDIQIKYVDISAAGKLQSLMASGNTPDIIRIYGASQLPFYIQNGIAMDLQPYFDKSKNVFNPSNFEPVDNVFKYDKKTGKQGVGDMYGFPKDWSQDFTMWFNKAIFKKDHVPLPSTTKPMTWQQMFALAKKMTKVNSKGKVTQYGMGYYNTNMQANEDLVLLQLNQEGVDPWSKDWKTADFATPKSEAILNEWVDAVKANIGNNSVNQDPNWAGNLFQSGKMAMFMSGYWYSGQLRSGIGTKGFNINDFVMAPAPVVKGGIRMDPTGAATGGIVYSGTKHPDQTWQVFEYLFAGQPAVDRAKSGWGLPALKSNMRYLPNKTAFDKQVLKVQKAQLKYAQPFVTYNPFIQLSAVNSLFDKYMIPVYYGRATVTQAAQQLDQGLNAAIAAAMQTAGIS